MANRILMVDDEPDILKGMAFWLRKKGYEVLTAENGEEALEIVQRERLDLVFLDLRLPLLDGYEVCRRMKADEGLKGIPVIFLTADSSIKIVQETKASKAEGYLLKPFGHEQLEALVQRFIPQDSSCHCQS